MISDGTHQATAPIERARPSRDTWLLFATRFIQLFAYGSVSVVLVFYLIGVGLTEPQTGLLVGRDLFEPCCSVYSSGLLS